MSDARRISYENSKNGRMAMWLKTVKLDLPAGDAAMIAEAVQDRKRYLERELLKITPGKPLFVSGSAKIEELDRILKTINRAREN